MIHKDKKAYDRKQLDKRDYEEDVEGGNGPSSPPNKT